MERKTLLLILSGLILSVSFVPFIKWSGFSMSAFDFVVSDHTPSIKILLIVVPICAICLLTGALTDQQGIMRNRYLRYGPVAAMIVFLILLFSTAENRTALDSSNPLTIFDLGMWVIFGASLLLTGIRRKNNYLIRL